MAAAAVADVPAEASQHGLDAAGGAAWWIDGQALRPTRSASTPSDQLQGALAGWDGVGYKVVAKVGRHYFSVWAGDTAEYVLGVPAEETAQPNHGGGLYCCRTREAASRQKIAIRRGGLFIAPRVLLRCVCEGPFIQYASGKIACSRITPLEELALPIGYLHHGPGAARPAARPLPARPVSPAFLAGLAGMRPQSALRSETDALEREVAEMERRLGYRS
eukprot:TRINITY_DN26442_c0_g1_i1.p1 TRINITY_DN26442_c0_g1~~TRINITY_DN26442_c0_g1_i1.p1  ORF type:complete len:219 (+),score=37.51 TRINITY_DN26442_c0_g1_i1:78-734(+)